MYFVWLEKGAKWTGWSTLVITCTENGQAKKFNQTAVQIRFRQVKPVLIHRSSMTAYPTECHRELEPILADTRWQAANEFQ